VSERRGNCAPPPEGLRSWPPERSPARKPGPGRAQD
jgi:hypothetical protein